MAERSQSGVILQRLEELAASDELAKYERYFPIAQRGADVFIGVRMGEAFALAKHHVGMPLGEIEALLETPIHEVVREGHAATMPRTTLRYAIEKLPQDQRKHYLGLKSRSPG
ncbi:MAG TPA: hypothetical protein VGO31_02375 [Microbacteriaceae bacterium]|nr:hypothetical protein [Microbacteriaceae bacterium]